MLPAAMMVVMTMVLMAVAGFTVVVVFLMAVACLAVVMVMLDTGFVLGMGMFFFHDTTVLSWQR